MAKGNSFSLCSTHHQIYLCMMDILLPSCQARAPLNSFYLVYPHPFFCCKCLIRMYDKSNTSLFRICIFKEGSNNSMAQSRTCGCHTLVAFLFLNIIDAVHSNHTPQQLFLLTLQNTYSLCFHLRRIWYVLYLVIQTKQINLLIFRFQLSMIIHRKIQYWASRFIKENGARFQMMLCLVNLCGFSTNHAISLSLSLS